MQTDWVGSHRPTELRAAPWDGTAPDRAPDLLRDARVLVVEDEFLVAAQLEDALSELGCDVVGPAPDLARALALLQVEPLDAAVLDVNLRGEAVFPVAEALEGRGVPFVFATAYGAAGVIARFADRAILEKPYPARNLERALREALRGGSAH